MFCKEKKIQVSEEKFSECEEGEKMFKYRISGVRKKRSERKSSERRFLGGNFAKFVFAGWASCCETWLKFEIEAKITVGNKKNDCGCRARA